jgi:hypothetical protein
MDNLEICFTKVKPLLAIRKSINAKNALVKHRVEHMKQYRDIKLNKNLSQDMSVR